MRVHFPLAIFPLGILGLASAALIAAPVVNNPVLGVVSSRGAFALSRVDTRPEAGPLPVVDGDDVAAGGAPVLFRLTGPNRVVLGGNSRALIRPIHDAGRYFYLSKGSIQFDALKEPLAICAAGRLYVPLVPASGEVVILDDRQVEVHMTSGGMERNGKEPCGAKAPAFLLQSAVGAVGAAGAAGAAGAVTAAGAGAATAAGAGAAGAATVGAATAGAAVAGAASAATVAAVGAGAAVAAGVATVTSVTGSAATPPTPPQASVSIPTP